MKYRLIDFPSYIPVETYNTAVEKVCRELARQTGILAVYQVGSTGNPGISDIDLVAVFKDGAACGIDPLSVLNYDERRAFAHPVFSIEETLFNEFQEYSLFHDYLWHWGIKFDLNTSQNTGGILNKQVALEYLLSNYIGRTRDKRYGVLSVRNLFLSGKAIGFDLELLNVQGGDLYDCVQELIQVRNNWFDGKYDGAAIQTWFESFYASLAHFLADYLEGNKLVVPGVRNYKYSRNIYLIPGNSLNCGFKGIILPSLAARLHKKLAKLNEFSTRFDIYIPMEDCPGDNSHILNRRNEWFRRMLKNRKRNFPYFTSLANNLQAKLLK
jgi:hypothetical protein